MAGATAPSISTTALIGAIPLTLGAVAMAVYGVETRRRQLEHAGRTQVGVAQCRLRSVVLGNCTTQRRTYQLIQSKAWPAQCRSRPRARRLADG